MGALTSYYFENRNIPLPLIEIVSYIPNFDIQATAGPNGVIDPSGTVPVKCGTNQLFSFLPDLGYVVDYFVVDGVTKPKAGSYTFPNVHEPHTIHVAFKEAPYTIYFTHEGEGEVIPVGREAEIQFGLIGMDDGDMQLFVFTPAPNWEIQAVYINGQLNPGALQIGAYMFINVHENHTVHVIFKLIDIEIFASSGPDGAISPAGTVLVPYGTDQPFAFTPNEGYVLDQAFKNTEPIPSSAITYDPVNNRYNYVYENVIASGTIFVTFKKETYYIYTTVIGCGNSTVQPSGVVPVLYHDHQVITFIPDEGCKVADVIVDGASYPPAVQTGSYEFFYMTENHTIEVIFTKIQYPITATINGNGAITPAGTTYVDHGDNQKYNIVTTNGYKIANVFVDGANNPDAVASGTYTFTNVTAPHSISVVTTVKTFTITASAGAGGYISPAGTFTLAFGENKLFNFIAAQGYEIEEVLIDGSPNAQAMLDGSFAFINIAANHTIHVTFKKLTFKMLSKANEKGSIYPEGEFDVTYGEDVVYTITPDEGYKVSHVLVNGKNMGAITTYTFPEVEADGIIEAFFMLNPTIGIEDPTIEGVSIYSQHSTVYIVNTHLLPIRDVSIMDMYGRVVWQGKVYSDHNAITLDVATGIYNVRVITDNNVTTTKVSIQR